MKSNYTVAVHGGAGTLAKRALVGSKSDDYHQGLRAALETAATALSKGASAMEGACLAVQCLEDNSLFNAGKGSVLSHEGNVQMDAAVMNGKNLKAGAVAGVSGIANPVLLARAVMDNSPHVLLAGPEVLEFATEQGFEIKDSSYFRTQLRIRQLEEAIARDEVILDHDPSKGAEQEDKFGTVGAVALDRRGNLAAATSTGGMTNKRYGRIGDSPIIGAGTYADNRTCAVSCTGHGEYFLRLLIAHDIACLMRYAHMPLNRAADTVITDSLKRLGGRGGFVALDRFGNVEMRYTTRGMYRGLVSDKQGPQTFIFD